MREERIRKRKEAYGKEGDGSRMQCLTTITIHGGYHESAYTLVGFLPALHWALHAGSDALRVLRVCADLIGMCLEMYGAQYIDGTNEGDMITVWVVGGWGSGRPGGLYHARVENSRCRGCDGIDGLRSAYRGETSRCDANRSRSRLRRRRSSRMRSRPMRQRGRHRGWR